jgi:protein-tyrosine phosphatase
VSTTHQRHAELQGQANFRDLGGYQTVAGLAVNWAQVYRSGRLSALTDADVAQLRDLGIRTVVSLLTSDDVQAYGPNRLTEDAQEIALPIDSDTATELSHRATAALKSGDFSHIPPDLNVEIHRILIHDGVRQYAQLMRLIADPANRPLVFHCSHGVHRTGTGAAILLSALGVPWKTVREDYLLSNIYRHDEVQKRLAQLRQLAAEKQGVLAEQVDMSNMEAFLIQHGSYIDACYDEMVKEFGSVESFIRDGLGLNEQEVYQLRDELLE